MLLFRYFTFPYRYRRNSICPFLFEKHFADNADGGIAYDEKDLLEKLKKGDCETWNFVIKEFLFTCAKKGAAEIFKKINKNEVIEDVAQKAIAQLYKQTEEEPSEKKDIHSCKTLSDVKRLVFKIGYRRAQDFVKPKKVYLKESLDQRIESIGEQAAEINCGLTEPERTEISKLLDQVLEEFCHRVKKNPKKYEECKIKCSIFRDRFYLHDNAYENLAKKYDKSISYIRMAIFHIKRNLKENQKFLKFFNDFLR